MADKYFAVPQGKVYIASRDANGQTSGFTWIGDTDGFTITTSQQYLDIQESYSGNRGTVAHIPTSSDYAAELSILNINGENLARAFYGESASVAGAAVVGEAVTAFNGQMSALKYPDVSSVTVKKGATTLVAGTDYTLDAKFGTITILPGSTQVTGSTGVALTVDYTHGAIASRMKLLTQGLKDYTLRFEGTSKFDDLAQVGVIHRIALDMAQTLSLIGASVNKLVVKGKLLPAAEQPAGESQYFTYLQK